MMRGTTETSTARTLRYDEARDFDRTAASIRGHHPIAAANGASHETHSTAHTTYQPVLRMGNDWACVLDESTRDFYFCNLKTGDASWAAPAKTPPPTQKEMQSLLSSSRTMPAHLRVHEPLQQPLQQPLRRDVYHDVWTNSQRKEKTEPPPVPFARASSFAASSSSSMKHASRAFAKSNTPCLDVSTHPFNLGNLAKKDLPFVTKPWERFGRNKSTSSQRVATALSTKHSKETETVPENENENETRRKPEERLGVDVDVCDVAIFANHGKDTESGDFAVTHPTTHATVSPPFVENNPANARGKDKEKYLKKKTEKTQAVPPERPSPSLSQPEVAPWNSAPPKDDEKTKARGAALSAARAASPRVSSSKPLVWANSLTKTTTSPKNTTYTAESPFTKSNGSSSKLSASPETSPSPRPALTLVSSSRHLRSVSSRERALEYGEQVRARQFNETSVAAAPKLKPVTTVASQRGTSVFSARASPSPSPSPSPRFSSVFKSPSVSGTSFGKSPSDNGRIRSVARSDTGNKKQESHNPFAGIDRTEESAAVTMQAGLRSFLARKRAREIKAWAATKAGVDKVLADERLRKEAQVAQKAKVAAERARKTATAPPELLGSFRSPETGGKVDSPKTGLINREPSATSSPKTETVPTAASEPVPPEPEPVVPTPEPVTPVPVTPEPAREREPVVEPTRVVVAGKIQVPLSFEEYASAKFFVGTVTQKKPGCFGCLRAKPSSGLSPTTRSRWSSKPLVGALTAAAISAGVSRESTELFTSLLAAARGNRALFQTTHVLLLRRVTDGPDLVKNWELRNEWYCQALKQLNGNPSKTRSARVWRLLYLAACAFVPSQDLAPYVLARCMREGSVVASLVRLRLVAQLTQGGSFDNLTHPRNASAADRDDFASVPAFGATVEEIVWLEAMESRRKVNKENDLHGHVTGTDPDLIQPSPETPLPAALVALLRRVALAGAAGSSGVTNSAANQPAGGPQTETETKGGTGLFRAAKEHVAAAAAIAGAAGSSFQLEQAANTVSPKVAAELVKLWLTGLPLPVIPMKMHADCVLSPASPRGVTNALAPLPPTHRASLTAILRAAASAAKQDANGDAGSPAAARAAEAIAAALAPSLMPRGIGNGERDVGDAPRDTAGAAVFVTRLIRMMLMRM